VIYLRESKEDEITSFMVFEQSEEALEFVTPYSFEQHCLEMKKPDIFYLTITHGDTVAGFIILAKDSQTKSVEFRRIIVSSKGKGIGQQALSQMEAFCAETLECNSIWLDVFESNKRGQHIYKKFGYKQFKTGDHDGRVLLYFNKEI
jgi:RimJ/RimL family protein N-acetyltransferase